MHKYYIIVSFKQVINTKLIPTSSILCIMWVSEGITMSSYTYTVLQIKYGNW